MVATFKVVLITVIIMSFMGVIGETKDKDLRKELTAICIAGILGFIVSSVVL